jgi:RNA polymerase sigma factor (TIGR02999 family)
MRRILVNHALSRRAAKRAGEARKVPLDEALEFFEVRSVDLVVLDEAMKALAKFDPRQSQIVELRFFGGLTIEETADVTGVSPATVKREWTAARLWLLREMQANDA